MTKVEKMDNYLNSIAERISSSEICSMVLTIFGLDLEKVSILPEWGNKGIKPPVLRDSLSIIDSYLNLLNKKITGAEIRRMINQIFGINLDAISTLEGARISLYSKDQWVLQHEKDLFVVYAGKGDVDVNVHPTKFFTEQTGLGNLPNELQLSLTNLGFYYDEEISSYYFLNPTGEAVPDAFKGQTIVAIIECIRKSYSHL